MTDENPMAGVGKAVIRNMVLFDELVRELKERKENDGLRRMGGFTGFSGIGKTESSVKAANTHRAYYVRMMSVTTRRQLLEAILFEMGIEPESAALGVMVAQVGKQLTGSERPLIIDEADFLLRETHIELLRDIFDCSRSIIIMIGEENFAARLARWDRVYQRVIWRQAVLPSIADTRKLVEHYFPHLAIEDSLLKRAHAASGVSVRLIVSNLAEIAKEAKKLGHDIIKDSEFTGEFLTGRAPAPRRKPDTPPPIIIGAR